MDTPWSSRVCLVIISLTIASESVNGLKIVGNPDVIKNVTEEEGAYVLTMDENNHVTGANNISLFNISETTEYPTISFVDQTKTFKSSISSVDGLYEFYAAQYFDYETQPNEYRFMVSPTTFVILKINNIDDEPPTLSSPMCSFDENTYYGIGNTTCECTVSDPDGWLGKMTFTIVDSSKKNESKIFELKYKKTPEDTIYEAPVYIIVKEQLDYETITFYSFNISAKDGAGHSTYPNPDVRAIIYVEDLNDMPPEFTSYVSTAQFDEKSKQSFQVVAVDGDKQIQATINYTVIDDEQEKCVKMDPHNGTITVSPIDRDARDILTYQYTIVATEEDIPAFQTSQLITYYIQDIDDNAPLVVELKDNEGTVIEKYPRNYTDNKVAYFKILENYNQSSLDLYINITDIDTGVNAQFDLSLKNYNTTEGAEDYTSAFFVVPTAGYRTGDYQINIKNVSKLDYEVPEWDHIKFYVHSTGNNKSKEDYLLISIDLMDYNDELPKFALTEYAVQINETLGYDEFIIQVMATDRDAEDKILEHELVGSASITDLLRINSSTGEIHVNKKNAFDYDKINPVIVQVKAIDKVKHTAVVPLTITLLDVNNKAPSINVEGIIRVDENQDYGTVLEANITASDVDTTRNLTAAIDWSSSYAMKNSQQLTDPDKVELIRFLDLEYTTNVGTGTITIQLVVNEKTKTLPAPDFETFDTLYLSVIVTDLNTDQDFIECCKKSLALITININDINDNPPIFTEETIKLNRSAYENAEKGIIVGSIIATDADVGSIVTYNCTCLDEDKERDWFAFNKSTGEITVKSSRAIDADKYPNKLTVNYSCTATDGKFYTYQNFSIYIIDKNNQNPVFMDKFVNINIDEQSSWNSTVTKINLTDADRDPPFHTVQCVFYNISEDCYSSFFITPENNSVQVKIGGNDLNRDTGLKWYMCSVRCIDNPNRERSEDQLQTDTQFNITLNDINNNAPELINASVRTSENIKKDQDLATIFARDIDSGKNSEIDFVILEVTKDESVIKNNVFNFSQKNDYFLNDTVKRLTLVSLKDLKDLYGNYIIKINMTDRGTPMKNRTAKLNVVIDKFNFFAPSFIFPGPDNKSLVLSLDQEPYKQLVLHLENALVPDISVTDDDKKTCSGKWKIEFERQQVEPSGVSIFVINTTASEGACSGQLQVNNYFDKEQAKSRVYILTLTASLKNGEPDTKNGEKPYSVSQNLTISFFDVNQDPIFPSLGPWNFIMAEDDESLVQQLPEEFQAYYPNIPEKISTFYFLRSSNLTVNDTFIVDENTGAVSLKKPLTFLEIRQYNFQILASKDKSGSSSNSQSILDVIVKVNETNRHAPQWEQSTFFGAIMSTYPRDYKILTANASDLDEIDQGKLKYKRIGTIERAGSENIYNVNEPAFLYDGITGDVTLNFVVDNSMSGYFWFNVYVEDVKDWKGNGPYNNTTNVTIYIVTQEKNTVSFRFANTLTAVIKAQSEVLQLISHYLGYDCHAAAIDHDSQNGQDLDNQTLASIYCVNNNTLVTTEDILKKVSNLNTFENLRTSLLNNWSVWLLNFSTESTPENLEETLKAALIGVSVLLGACCLILAITFFLKTRELNRRLKKLTEPKFGSDESDLNRKGLNNMKAPNTNVHAVEGSNPIFNINGNKDIDFGYEKASIHSGNSDLIGVEDRPEFDFFDTTIKDKDRF